MKDILTNDYFLTAAVTIVTVIALVGYRIIEFLGGLGVFGVCGG